MRIYKSVEKCLPAKSRVMENGANAPWLIYPAGKKPLYFPITYAKM